MTLTTTVAVATPVPVEPLWRFCQSLLGDPDAMASEHEPDDGYGDGVYRNVPGQGLPALLWLYYGLDGPRDNEGVEETPPHVIAVHVDTPYGFEGGPDLHAWFVRELGAHLDDMGAVWWWQQEYTGAWFRGADRLEELGDPDRGDPHA